MCKLCKRDINNPSFGEGSVRLSMVAIDRLAVLEKDHLAMQRLVKLFTKNNLKIFYKRGMFHIDRIDEYSLDDEKQRYYILDSPSWGWPPKRLKIGRGNE
jgi:hypothetical protein